MSLPSTQRDTNHRLWLREDLVRRYQGRSLRPVEITLLLRYRQDLVGRVLDLGCGAGRLTGYLSELSDQVTGIDSSPHMLAALRECYPQIRAEKRDLRDLGEYADGSFDAVVGAYNIADVLDHAERGAFLDEIGRILIAGGLLLMSGHNRGAEHRITEPLRLQVSQPIELAALILGGHRWRRNRRRLLPHERRESEYAILNDQAHDFDALHYYIDRDAQVRQLADHGFGCLECLDLDGLPVRAGEAAAHSPELHYAARTPSAPR